MSYLLTDGESAVLWQRTSLKTTPRFLWHGPFSDAPVPAGALHVLLHHPQTYIQFSNAQETARPLPGFVYDQTAFDDKLWLTAAVPEALSRGVLETCRHKKIRTGRVLRMDAVEHVLARYFYAQTTVLQTPLWVLFPQGKRIAQGLRLFIFADGGAHAFFFSAQPEAAHHALERIAATHPLPAEVHLLADDTADGTFSAALAFLKERGTPVFANHSFLGMVAEAAR